MSDRNESRITHAHTIMHRRWVREMGAQVTMSEMAFAKQLLKGDKVERARLVKDEHEGLYGFQIATKMISEGVEASKVAAESGARWIDLNCG
jgi:tRNA-dihydrouridine synthase 3